VFRGVLPVVNLIVHGVLRRYNCSAKVFRGDDVPVRSRVLLVHQASNSCFVFCMFCFFIVDASGIEFVFRFSFVRRRIRDFLHFRVRQVSNSLFVLHCWVYQASNSSRFGFWVGLMSNSLFFALLGASGLEFVMFLCFWCIRRRIRIVLQFLMHQASKS
jgi:hypothetical protein